MKILTDKHKYPTLVRHDSPNGRTYQVNGEGAYLPSVTTILSATKSAKDKKTLDDWRIKVGEEEATRIVNESTNIGTHLHQNLENHIRGIPDRAGPLISKIMTDMIIKKGLCNVNEVWGIEASVYYPDLYAGTADLIGVHNGNPCIIDFKNSKKNKKKEWITDYKVQLAAYALAHNAIFNTNIKGGVIMMATRDLTYLEFDIQGSEFQESCDDWNRRVDLYYQFLATKPPSFSLVDG